MAHQSIVQFNTQLVCNSAIVARHLDSWDLFFHGVFVFVLELGCTHSPPGDDYSPKTYTHRHTVSPFFQWCHGGWDTTKGHYVRQVPERFFVLSSSSLLLFLCVWFHKPSQLSWQALCAWRRGPVYVWHRGKGFGTGAAQLDMSQTPHAKEASHWALPHTWCVKGGRTGGSVSLPTMATVNGWRILEWEEQPLICCAAACLPGFLTRIRRFVGPSQLRCASGLPYGGLPRERDIAHWRISLG